jgi:hypothetical protein
MEPTGEFIPLKDFLRDSNDWQDFLKTLDLEDYPLNDFPIFIWNGNYQACEKIFMILAAANGELITNKSLLKSYDDWNNLLDEFKHFYQEGKIKIEPLYKELYWLDLEFSNCTFEQLLDLAYRLESYFGFVPTDTDCFSDESSDSAIYYSILSDWIDDYELKDYTFRDFLLSCSGEYWWEVSLAEKFDSIWGNERFQEIIKVYKKGSNPNNSLYWDNKKIGLMEKFLEGCQEEIIHIAKEQYAKTKLSRKKWLNTVGDFWKFLSPAESYSPTPLIYSKGKDFYEWEGHYFRSTMEMKIAQALDAKGVLFFPNAGCRVKGDTKMLTREPDFLIFYEGNWGILECDGKQYHLDPEKDKEREQLFKNNGIKFIERYGYKDCNFKSKDTVDKFLKNMEDFYKKHIKPPALPD